MKAFLLAGLMILLVGCTQPGDIAKAYLSGMDKYVEIVATHTLPCEGCSLVSLQSQAHTYGVVVRDGTVVQATRDGTYNLVNNKPVSEENTTVFFCGEKRPSICDDIFDPVCTSNNQQAPNACTACADTSVEWYVRGECSSGYFETVYNDLQAGRITGESGPALVVVGWNLEN